MNSYGFSLVLTGLATTIVSFTTGAFAGGEMVETTTRNTTTVQSEELRKHYASRQKALAVSEADAMAGVMRETRKLASLTTVAPPAKDKYGDPMYGAYGPLPFSPGSPMYDGPRYAASFDRYMMLPMPDGTHRGYYRQAFSNPGLTARSDVSLGVGASQSYFTSGMMVHPGSMAPSAARVMTNNRW
jgi:hypothetical protein